MDLREKLLQRPGIESEIETVLLLSGVTSREDLRTFPYQPHHILDGIGGIPETRS